jgi:7-cyano-7-deazaguanine synthase in queuosine biosynthesis
MPERLVLCGGAKRPGRESTLRLALNGRPQNITLKLEDISKRLVKNVPDLLIDLIEIATYVYCADQATSRGGEAQVGMGSAWRRSFHFVIPVRNPNHWSNRKVLEPLCDTLSFLSEDDYTFEFEKAANPVPLDKYLELSGDDAAAFKADEVVLFSGGLDSLSGAIEELAAGTKNVALVSHRSSSKIFDYQKQLVAELKHRFPKRLMHVPVLVTRQEPLRVQEHTQRSRSFLYTSLACVVAQLFGNVRIRFFENGVVSINLPISEQVVGARATRTTHPLVLERFREFFSAAVGKSIEVGNPFIWKTKADVIRSIVERGCGPLIKHTVSCTRSYDITKLHTHCGCCSQCLDRRFAVLAADAAEHDPAEMYKVELLTGERNRPNDQTMAESYVRTAVELRDLGELAFFGRFSGEAARVCSGFPALKSDDVARQVLGLHQRHGQAIWEVLKAAVENHSAELVKQSLPPSSVLMMTVVPGATPALSTGGKHADPLELLLEDDPETAGNGGGGRYIPDWERLLNAVKRVMTTGVNEATAKVDLCRAISDRKVKVRFRVEKEEGIGSIGEVVVGTVRHGSDVAIPTHLKPSDFDWQRSRPLKPWRDIRQGFDMLAALWHLEWIEVLRDDVSKVLCGVRIEHEQAAARGVRAAAQRVRAKSQPALERARGAISELYPQGLPGQAAEPNTILCRRVGEELKQAGLPGVSDDTILRAAGRRK